MKKNFLNFCRRNKNTPCPPTTNPGTHQSAPLDDAWSKDWPRLPQRLHHRAGPEKCHPPKIDDREAKVPEVGCCGVFLGAPFGPV